MPRRRRAGLWSSVPEVVGELLLLSLLFAAGALLLPIVRAQSGAAPTGVRAPYSAMASFLCIGAGFMILEVGLMQRLVLYLGHPTHALTTVLSGLLMGTGAGSFLAGRLSKSAQERVPLVVALAAAAVIAALNQIQPIVFGWTQGLTVPVKVVLTESMMIPVGLLLGMLMPTGIGRLRTQGRSWVAWAWGLNGFASVAGSCIAVLFAMSLGFRATLYLAAGLYLLAGASSLLLPKAERT